MRFQHSGTIWRDFPELVPGALYAEGITPDAAPDAAVAAYGERAAARLATASEGELPEIQAWRRAFTRMGLKPTQYRCASEALLRRFRKDGSLPRLHPLIDLCNAVSIAYAIPIAVFDVSRIASYVEVRHATGEETYLTFSGETERPPAGEVVFADAEGRAHARRWTNRQSGLSAVRETTERVLIVAEALHETAAGDVESLLATLTGELNALWPVTPKSALLTAAAPRFEFTGD
ncbi:B3/B4 domain-containing protein [Nonomuraea candida]|uniref:B3/B4 domain-containing protein n=1 Tax=Nonomuraea candida TaxID=359159 RepID=UPI0005B9AF2D|nr:phenylalanine--tRNA ligase beta subunit-related protein [Nonomuraea candida]